MKDDQHSILDMPERVIVKPKPKLYTSLLMVGIVLITAAAILRIVHVEAWALTLFAVAWGIMFVHFLLKVFSNHRFYRKMCVRDLGRLGVVTAVTMRIFEMDFALWVMVTSGVVYAFGFFGAWGPDEH